MTDAWKLPWEGGCLCGGVRFRITAAPLLSMACHCAGCQKLTASAFALTVVVPKDGFAPTKGAPEVGGLHREARHLFCPYCKNWVFTEPSDLPMVNVRATMLDDHAWFAPYVELYTAEKLAWATTPAKHSYATYPAPDGYGPLVEAFAREGARPV